MTKRKWEITWGEVIDRWAKNYDRVMTWIGKLQAKEASAWYLWVFCKCVNKTPDELLALKDNPASREAEYLLDKFVADEKLDLTNSTKVKVVIAVKSFFKHNYRDLARASGQISLIKQKPYRRHSKEELMKIYRAALNPRDRALIPFTWSTAIAKETLSTILWKHLEPDWEKQEIPHIGLPDVLLKGHGRGKYKGVEQHTFLTPEAKRDLLDYKDYLERVKGVKLTPESHVWIQLVSPFDPVDYDGFARISSELSKRSGVQFSWHDARRYVETALEEIKIHPNWARKIRGRKVKGEENPYSRPAIEQLRKVYCEAVPLLQFTTPTDLDYVRKRQEVSETIMSKIMSGEHLSDEDRANIKRYNIKLAERATRRTEHNGGDCGETFEQINESQLLQYLKAGWSIVKELQSGGVIVKR